LEPGPGAALTDAIVTDSMKQAASKIPNIFLIFNPNPLPILFKVLNIR
jgi:hypothetical protein